MFHNLFEWLQYELGANLDEGIPSWSEQLLGSLNLWSVLEGTHTLTLMLFAGTIWLVDLRMMGIIFKNVPFSKVNDKVLPYTVVGFLIMIVTGIILFGAKPLDYYHSVWFRGKMIFMILAAANIFWFHFKVQKTQDEWDTNPNPPRNVKLSAYISMTSWILIIIFGRLIAYNWFECGKAQPGVINWAAECSSTFSGSISYGDIMEEPEPIADSVAVPPPAEPADVIDPWGDDPAPVNDAAGAEDTPAETPPAAVDPWGDPAPANPNPAEGE